MKKLMLATLIPLLVLVTPQVFANPHHCSSYSECYNIGYGHGYSDAQNGHSPVNSCQNHSQAYCYGYDRGYRDVSSNPNSGLQQGESSQVNIRGNNNDVNINQEQNVQSGSGGDGGNSYHGANPRCLLICAAVSH